MSDRLQALRGGPVDTRGPVLLHDGPHAVYWVGAQEDSPFRCNAYLIVDGDYRVLMDPGSQKHHFAQVRARVAQIIPPESVTHIVVHHQDPDLCDSLPDWLAINRDIILVATPRTRVLLPYYGLPDEVRWLDASPNDTTCLELPGGALWFITSPFLHFPEAMTTFDEATGYLFSSDIGAAVERDWELVVSDWDRHWRGMVPFHVFYMASNRALRGYVDKISAFPVQAMLPQHGSILAGPEMVKRALAALRELPCGIDLLYPASNLERALEQVLR